MQCKAIEYASKRFVSIAETRWYIKTSNACNIPQKFSNILLRYPLNILMNTVQTF